MCSCENEALFHFKSELFQMELLFWICSVVQADGNFKCELCQMDALKQMDLFA